MSEETIHSFILSFQVALISTCLVVSLGILIALFLAKTQFKGKTLLEVILTLPLVLPPSVIGYYLLVLLGRQGIFGRILDLQIIFTWKAAVISSFIVSLPLMIKIGRSAIEGVDQSLIHASYMLGHSKVETFFKVILPLSLNGIIAGAVLSFARGLGEFGATLMFAGLITGKTDTVPLRIYSLTERGSWDEANKIVILYTLIAASFLYLSTRFKFRIH